MEIEFLKCLVWNMDYWKSKYKEEGWQYINSQDPDFCLLNECIDHPSQKSSVHYVSKNNWGNGVFSKHNITEHELEFGKVHSDAISCADLNIEGKDIILISLYGKMINGNAISTLHRCLSDLTHLFYKKKLQKWILIGGDFNADEALDETQRNRAHHLFFERLKDFGFYDCCKKFNSERVRTLRHKHSDFHWQNDYLFAGKKLYDACTSSKVIDDPSLYEISDHNPIIAEFDLSLVKQ